MLVLLGPDFDGSADAYKRLTRVTGLVGYDLKSRVRPGMWGVVKALADDAQAEALAAGLELAGFRPQLITRQVAHDPERRIVHVLAVTLNEKDLVLELSEGTMPVDYSALACVVRGEVQPGRTAGGGLSGASSSSARVGSGSEPPNGREQEFAAYEAYQAADLHFMRVRWFARIDARIFGVNGARDLDALCDTLARCAGVRVDRAVRSSSLVSFGEQAGSLRAPPSETLRRDQRREQPDERFDAYSRLVAEAERRSLGAELAQPGEGSAQPA